MAGRFPSRRVSVHACVQRDWRWSLTRSPATPCAKFSRRHFQPEARIQSVRVAETPRSPRSLCRRTERSPRSARCAPSRTAASDTFSSYRPSRGTGTVVTLTREPHGGTIRLITPELTPGVVWRRHNAERSLGRSRRGPMSPTWRGRCILGRCASEREGCDRVATDMLRGVGDRPFHLLLPRAPRPRIRDIDDSSGIGPGGDRARGQPPSAGPAARSASVHVKAQRACLGGGSAACS